MKTLKAMLMGAVIFPLVGIGLLTPLVGTPILFYYLASKLGVGPDGLFYVGLLGGVSGIGMLIGALEAE